MLKQLATIGRSLEVFTMTTIPVKAECKVDMHRESSCEELLLKLI